MGKVGLLLTLAALAAGAPARAQEAPVAPAVEGSEGSADRSDAAPGIRTRAEGDTPEGEAEGEAPPLPWLRLELTGRAGFPLIGKFKHGPESNSTGVDLQKDAHLPARPTWGITALVDVELASWCSLGAVYWGMANGGPSAEVHYRGITLDEVTFPGGSRVRTDVDIQYAELSLRYVWVNRETVRLWFGIGPAYLHARLRLRGEGRRARADVAALLGPALTYQLEARVGPVTLFLSNGITLGLSDRLPSFVSSSRFGARWHLGGGLQVVTAIDLRNGLLTSWNEQLRRDHLTQGHEWSRVRFNNAAVEVGLAWTY